MVRILSIVKTQIQMCSIYTRVCNCNMDYEQPKGTNCKGRHDKIRFLLYHTQGNENVEYGFGFN